MLARALLLFFLFSMALSANVIIKTCSGEEFFDISGLKCTTCGENKVADSSGLGCTCAQGFRILQNEDGFTCESCLAQGLVTSKDHRFCVGCDNSTGAVFSATKGDCVCPSGAALVDRDARGDILPAKQCWACGGMLYPGSTAPSADSSSAPPTLSTYDPWTMRAAAPAGSGGDSVCTAGSRTSGIPSAYPSYLQAPRRDLNMCRPCGWFNMSSSDGLTCGCPTGFRIFGDGTLCLADTKIAALTSTYTTYAQVTYPETYTNSKALSLADAQPSSTTVSSLFFRNNFLPGAIQCTAASDRVACNNLGNLCALQLYDKRDDKAHMGVTDRREARSGVGTEVGRHPNGARPRTDACILYNKLYLTATKFVNDFPSWPQALPWLYYLTESSSELDNTNIAMELAFAETEGKVSQLHFVLSVYAFNGTWLGFEDFNYQLQLCPSPPPAPAPFRKVGVAYQSACTLDLNDLLNMAESQGRMYDLYLDDPSSGLYPVPVRVYNYRDETGAQPNTKVTYTNAASSVLTRRFFLFDAVTGRENSDGDDPKDLLHGRSHKIAAVLDITYTDILASAIREGATKANLLSSPTVLFRVDYTMDLTDYWTVVYVLFSVIGALTAALFLLRLWTYIRLYQTSQLTSPILVRLFFTLLQYVSNVCLVVMAGLCLYWSVPGERRHTTPRTAL
ncbi:putative transmembrane protein [Paratrimastix pyriformis]|uniref:Transmembrane protein n=1 Tax=Paratrimastix pyriformis TaxID=342808 RepID=A0ABQ8UAZ3_9EUKA|nr:putative transmembrane protein [Paratrimastix pyriformis]